MTVYTGRPDAHPEGRRVSADGMTLSPEASLKLRNHSPTGFNWGYGGSGPAQLALAILLDVLGPKEALAWYQDFKREVVAGWPGNGPWQLTTLDVLLWWIVKEGADYVACQIKELAMARQAMGPLMDYLQEHEHTPPAVLAMAREVAVPLGWEE